MDTLLPASVLQVIIKTKHICVLTGAGISADSGIATFRGADGLWARYRPEDLATPDAFGRDPDLVWKWYQYRREIVAKAKPNPGHAALARWETLAESFTLVTQNVDGLHRVAGSRRVLELHGNIRINRCRDCGVESTMDEITYTGEVPRCPCGGMLRPGVVWFGEPLPEAVFAAALEAAQQCDLFLTVGTSAVVYPAAALPEAARGNGAIVIEVNTEETPFTRYATHHLRGPAGTMLPALLASLRGGSLFGLNNDAGAMRRSLTGLFLLLCLSGTLGSITGCAYYNTFYNVERKFTEAERDRRQAERQAQPQQPVAGAVPPATPAAPASGARAATPGAEKYRKVIETSSKLLEYYPKSRWVDDALYVMGVSYYWLGDLPRAERKFTELMTLFPKSKRLTDAVIWKARTLADQKKPKEAEALLHEHIDAAKSGPRKARILFLLGRMAYDDKRYTEAAENFGAAAEMKQAKPDRLNCYYYYALTQSALGDHEQARNGFMQVARRSSDVRQAYDASIQWSRAEQALGHFERANDILERVEYADRFFNYVEDTELEQARLKVESGTVDEGVVLYEKFITTHPSGERRGLAFYRLALIHRDHRVDLATAKALLDSVQRTGASKTVGDSARAALEQISKGLLALDRIRALQTNLHALDSTAVADSLLLAKAPMSAAPVAPAADSAAAPRPDTTASLPAIPALLPRDSLMPPEQVSAQSDTGPTFTGSPVASAADSTARRDSLTVLPDTVRADTVRSDSARSESAQTPVARPAAPEDAALTAARARQAQRMTLRRDLQVAYLHVAEFYEYSLADNDSALHYYRLAAADPLNVNAFWRANLYLARALTPDNGPPPAEALERYQIVMDADSVPLEAQNLARGALNLPLIEVPAPPEVQLLRRAEEAYLENTLPTDSLLRLYSEVVAVDSTTPEARIALYAKAMLFENTVNNRDSAHVIYARLTELHPDSAQSMWLRTKLAPPDSNSIFNMTDAQLSGAHPAVETLLEQEPDEKGWPPPEESLRGRRYR